MEELQSPDNEDLQNLINRAIQERKALLCLVFDETELSQVWEAQILDLRHLKKLKETTLCTKMNRTSSQAQLLSAVCPIEGSPAVIIVQNGQVVGNFQHGRPSGRNFLESIQKRYRLSSDELEAGISDVTDRPQAQKAFIHLRPSSGRMRLPNNAYDKLQKLTDEYLAQGLKGEQIGSIQFRLLKSTEIDSIRAAAEELEKGRWQNESELLLPDDVIDKLLNSPPSIISDKLVFWDKRDEEERLLFSTLTANPIADSQPVSAGSQSTDGNTTQTAQIQPALSQNQGSQSSSPQQPPTTNSEDLSQSSGPTRSSGETPPQRQSSSQIAQQSDYIRQQREREAGQKAERERIKAQIQADRDARRQAEAERKVVERQSELESLRKANSTTSNPQSSDVRIQVRTFDGSTIKTTFPKTATISKDVRPWVDDNRESKEPYDLKLILTPLPNHNIEAGEEEQVLSDLGIKGSCTMVMVPVKGFVESYTGDTSVSFLGSAVSGGYGLVSGAAGMLYGGVKTFLGAGVGSGASQTNDTAQQQENSAPQASSAPPGRSGGNVKVRTLADQRIEDAKRKGNQLYNGNQLNFEPRKDEDEEDRKRD